MNLRDTQRRRESRRRRQAEGWTAERYYGSGPRNQGPSPDSMQWDPQVGENEIDEWRKIFRDRRGE
jgi:hypothetical protein